MKKVKKLWGHEAIIINKKDYCGKILYLKKGFCSSLHYHKIKDETFYVLDGEVLMEYDNKKILMKKGDDVNILPNKKHRFSGIKDSKIIEFSTHHYDDDSYRIEKSRKML